MSVEANIATDVVNTMKKSSQINMDVSSVKEEKADDMLRSLLEKFKKKKLRAVDLFKTIDTSGDGIVSTVEFRDVLAELGFKPTDQDFACLMARIDRDGSGDVSIKEFDKALKAAEKLPPKRKEDAPKKKQGLSAEEKEEFRQIFCLFKQLSSQRANEGGDTDIVAWDDSGAISVDELEQLLETVGLRLDQRELETMIKEIDLDGNGEIDFEEFCTTMTRKINVEHPPDEIAKAFKIFACNAPEGCIAVRHLKNALNTYMHKELIAAEVEELVLHYQDCFFKINGSDEEYFNYQEYIDLMTPMVERGYST